MDMGDENIEDFFLVWMRRGKEIIAEFTQAAAHIAEHIFLTAGIDFAARRVAAIGAGDGKIETAVDKGIDLFRGAKRPGIAYMVIANSSAARDRLVGAAASVATSAAGHKTVMQRGVMKVRSVETIEIPTGGAVMLEPGGRHLMLTRRCKNLPARNRLRDAAISR
jgi:copper(I)-binding protein